MKVDVDTVHQHIPQQPQKQEIDDERIQIDEKQQQQQTRLSAFQEKMAPLMLFVVSMAQFIDISKFSLVVSLFVVIAYLCWLGVGKHLERSRRDAVFF